MSSSDQTFRQVHCGDHVSFTVQTGEVIGYLGPKWSGKTTTIECYADYHPNEGTAKIMGVDVVQDPEASGRIRLHVTKILAYDDLTVMEKISSFYAGVYDIPKENERRACKRLFTWLDWNLAPIGLTVELSGGWRQRLALGCAIIHKPPLLFLDDQPRCRPGRTPHILDLI